MSRVNSSSILTLNKINLPEDIIKIIISFWCRDLLNYKTLFKNSSKTSILFESINYLNIKYINIYESNDIIEININEIIKFNNYYLSLLKKLIKLFQICSICGNFIDSNFSNKHINCSCWNIYENENENENDYEYEYGYYYR
jgi:hypothetical protein